MIRTDQKVSKAGATVVKGGSESMETIGSMKFSAPLAAEKNRLVGLVDQLIHQHPDIDTGSSILSPCSSLTWSAV